MSNVYGYVRVSSADQNADRQVIETSWHDTAYTPV